MEENRMPHRLCLEGRERLSMTGAQEVLSFSEDAVVLGTSLGTLVVQGEQLRLKTLSPEGGQVVVEGTITAIGYETPRAGSGWLGRLFG